MRFCLRLFALSVRIIQNLRDVAHFVLHLVPRIRPACMVLHFVSWNFNVARISLRFMEVCSTQLNTSHLYTEDRMDREQGEGGCVEGVGWGE